ncbi:MAG: redoxin domain-containing protein [bacterium]
MRYFKNVFPAAVLWFVFSGVSAAFVEGDRMPNFGLPCSDGEYYTLSGVCGSSDVVVFTFFDSQCKPCREELPLIQAVRKKYRGSDVRFFMVAVGEESEQVEACIKEWRIDIPVLEDTSCTLAKKCDVVIGSMKNIPRTVVAGKDGRIKKIFKGYHADMEQALSNVIKSALAEKVVRQKSVRVLYTNSANGIIESCDCPNNPYGGLVRRLTFFSKTAKADLKVSAGDFFSPNDESIKNEYVAKIMDKLEYDAVGLGDQEFKTGTEFFIDILKKYPLPVVCANMQVCDENSCWFLGNSYIIKDVNGVKVGITGVVSQSCFLFYPKKVKELLKFTQTCVDALNSVVPELRKKKCDVVFVVAHVNEQELREIKEKVPGIDVIFTGHTQNKIYVAGKPVVVQAGAAGRCVGELLVEMDSAGNLSFSNEVFSLTNEIKKDDWGISQSEEYLIKYKKSLETIKK